MTPFEKYCAQKNLGSPQQIGEILRTERLKRGWSQRELGNRAGNLGQTGISAIERGQPRCVVPDILRVLAIVGIDENRLRKFEKPSIVETAPMPEKSLKSRIEALETEFTRKKLALYEERIIELEALRSDKRHSR